MKQGCVKTPSLKQKHRMIPKDVLMHRIDKQLNRTSRVINQKKKPPPTPLPGNKQMQKFSSQNQRARVGLSAATRVTCTAARSFQQVHPSSVPAQPDTSWTSSYPPGQAQGAS